MRSLVKHEYIRPGGNSLKNGLDYARYIKYREGADLADRAYFDQEGDVEDRIVEERVRQEQSKYVLMHTLILSPGVKGADMKAYTREVMGRLASKKLQGLEWFAVVHNNTDNPHVHVMLMGSDRRGRLVTVRKFDYLQMRAAGDSFLRQCGLIEKYFDRENKQERIFIRRYQCFEPWERIWEETKCEFKETKLVKHIRSKSGQEKTKAETVTKQPERKTLLDWLQFIYKKDRWRLERELARAVRSDGRRVHIRVLEDDVKKLERER